jgi:hypothetical protein
VRDERQLETVSAIARRAKKLEDWLDDSMMGKTLPPGWRPRVACAQLYGSHLQFKAVVSLVSRELFVPACSLLRPQWEAFTHGLWVWHCATDQIIPLLVKGDAKFKDPGVEIQALSKLEPYKSRGTLETLQKDMVRALHSFTHMGAHQVQRLITESHICQIYSLEEIADICLASARTALLSAASMAQIRGDQVADAGCYQQMAGLRGGQISCFHDLIPLDLRQEWPPVGRRD